MNVEFWEPWNSGVGLWGFIIAIVLIGSIFSYLKSKSRNELIREALRSGQTLDPDMLKDLSTNEEKGGQLLAGSILIAVAAGLLVFGYQIGTVEGDEQIFEIFKGIAAFPGLIGVVLLIAGLINKMTGGRR